MAALNHRCQQQEARWQEAAKLNNPTNMYDILLCAVREASYDVFERSRCKPPFLKEAIAHRHAALQGRREVRAFLKASGQQRPSVGMAFKAWLFQHKLDRATRRAQQANRHLLAI